MNKSIIRSYSSAIVKSLYEKVNAISAMEHNLTKGELRELFLTEILQNFLTSQFGVGSGVIIDIEGIQSKQTDIIIYDTRILPAIIKNYDLGVYPMESVIATIEVKSSLTKKELIKSENNLKHLNKSLKFHDKLLEQYGSIKPFILNGIIGFNKLPIKDIKTNDSTWLQNNIHNIQAICHVNNYSWLYYNNSWHFRDKDLLTFEETKRFIAWFMDNIRYLANERFEHMNAKYYGWMSKYIRE